MLFQVGIRIVSGSKKKQKYKTIFYKIKFFLQAYLQLDGSSNYVYRTKEFPGLGFMLKKNIFDIYMKEKLNECCIERSWNNWNLLNNKQAIELEVLIPDVSRVFHRPYDLSKSDFSYLKSLFNRKRKTNL